ncbi:hypothetical protein DFH09DRAFT_1423621 [Mycena vulgaris]|nr:hypothetical protein DFH09DRAFT_1423621 [Mycena vulgaris]
MPVHTQVTLAYEPRVDKIAGYLTVAAATLREIADHSHSTPFLAVISSVTASLLVAVQTAKRNKDDCAGLLESVHALLYAIISLHANRDSETLSPTTVNQIGKFTQTLQKIHVFVEAQQDGSRFKQFFRQNEDAALLRECNAGLEEALDAFKVHIGASVLTGMSDMQKNSERIHEELLELIATVSDNDSASDGISLSTVGFRSAPDSSDSFSLLPPTPKIFHGRAAELTIIVDTVLSGQSDATARIAILGAPGMGKTSLARAVLHHPAVLARYDTRRFFVASDSAGTSDALIALVGAHIGLKPSKNLTREVVKYFAEGAPALLVLDNLETSWERVDSRGEVEGFLALLADVQHLALIVTMRGAERPAKVRWTHQFIPPLNPLTHAAARETFLDIADNVHEDEDIAKLLLLTDNLPLAVEIIAHLADYEGCPAVLTRWETEKMSLFSEGYDKRSNLDISITLSLSGSRMTVGAKELLSLLSLLPDGLSNIELLQSCLPIDDVLACKTTLLRTSLAYADQNERLTTLVPIREYMRQVHPPSQPLVRSLRQYFQQLLQVYVDYEEGFQTNPVVVNRITLNLGNLQSILILGLQSNNPDLSDTLLCAMSLSRFNRRTNRGGSVLMDMIPALASEVQDHKIQALFIIEQFYSWHVFPIQEPERLIAQAREHFSCINNPLEEARFYFVIALYYFDHDQNLPSALNFFEKSLSLAKSSGYNAQQCRSLNGIAWLNYQMSNYPEVRRLGREGQMIARSSGNLYQESRSIYLQAIACSALGDYKQVVQLCQRSRELLGLCGLAEGEANLRLLNCEAGALSLKTEYAASYEIQTQIAQASAAVFVPVNYNYAMAQVNLALLDILMDSDKPESEVRESLAAARSVFSTMKWIPGETSCDIVLAELELLRGDTVAAKGLLQRSFNLSWGNDGEGISNSLERLGDIGRWGADSVDSMSSWAIVFLVHGLGAHSKPMTAKALCSLGDMFLSQGEEETARSMFTVALEEFTQMDVPRNRGECMLRLGDIAKRNGDVEKALDFWRAARPLFEVASQAKDVAFIDGRIDAAMTEQNKQLAHLSELRTPTVIETTAGEKERSIVQI